MEKYCSTLQYVVVDLTKEKWSVHSIPPKVFSSLLGGSGLGYYLYGLFSSSESSDNEVEPLVFTTGICTQFKIIENSSLTITGRSSFSKMVRSTHSSSSFSSFLISCGFSAIVLIGSARRQMVVEIFDQEILFTPSEKLIHKKVSESLATLNLTKDKAAILIGLAGENKVPYASMISDGKSLEREGFGSLLGAKKIKGLVIQKGSYSFHSIHQKEVSEIMNIIDDKIHRSSFMKREEKENHLAVIRYAHEKGFASVAHVSKRCDPRMIHLFGSTYPNLYSHTASSIIGEVTMKDLYGNTVVMNSTTLLAFGSNIKNFDPVLSATYTYLATDLGLEPISVALTLSWIMEGVSRGIVHDIPISYTDHSHVEEIIRSIASATGIGKKLSKGSASLASEYNNKEFISSVNGKEMLPLDPRGAYGQGLLIALGYDFLHPSEILQPLLPLTDISKKAKSVIKSELIYLLSSALGISYHRIVAFLYDDSPSSIINERTMKDRLSVVAKVVSYLVGEEYGDEELLDIAKRALKREEGVNHTRRDTSATLPLQFLLNGDSNYETESTFPFTKLLDEYKLAHEIEMSLLKEELKEK